MNFLERILTRKREEARTRTVPREALMQRPLYQAARRSLSAALHRSSFGIIAELKKASPSKGLIRPDFDVKALAESYQRGGASALSVLTETDFFQGSLEYLEAVRQMATVPLLRKDFIIDAYQLYEARAFGADAVLLIAAALDPGTLRALAAEASDLGLETLIEVHSEWEVEAALAAKGTVLGINNRDLMTFEVDLRTTERIVAMLPAGQTAISESGISTGRDIRWLESIGVHGALIGEAFMRAPDPGMALQELLREGRQGAE